MIRVVFHKYWVFQHNHRNKIKPKSTLIKNIEDLTPRNTLCEAKLDILIKKNNRNTTKNDIYLKMTPPLCAQVSLIGKHNHIINTSGSLKFFKVNSEVGFKNILHFYHCSILLISLILYLQTEQLFLQYFNKGMGHLVRVVVFMKKKS